MSQAAFRSRGDTIEFTNNSGGSLTVGNLIFLGGIAAILMAAGIGSTGPRTTLANGSVGTAAVGGVFQFDKDATLAVYTGAPAYWDVTASKVTPLSNGATGQNIWIGRFAQEAAQTQTYCFVSLNDVGFGGVGGSSPEFTYARKGLSASGDTNLFVAPFKMELVDAYVIARDTGAANVKLINVSTDMVTAIAKGTVNDTRVPFTVYVAAPCIVAQGAQVKWNSSAAQICDLYTRWRAA